MNKYIILFAAVIFSATLSAQNVGIDIQLPTEKLHVNGNIRVVDDGDLFGLDQIVGFNDLRLYGGPGGTSNGDIFILPNGNVGIGLDLAVPETRLHLSGDDNNGTTATLRITSSNGTQNMLLDGNEIDGIDSLGLYLQNNVPHPLVLANGGGNVGIGFTAPTEKLHVNGNLRLVDDADMYGLDQIIGFDDLRIYGTTPASPNDPSDLFVGPTGDVLIQNGNLGIGAPASERLRVNGKIQFAGLETLEDGGPNEIAARGDVRASVDDVYDLGTSAERWNDVYATNGVINTSDRRDKQNIQELEYGLAEILQLRPVRYEWKHNSARGQKLGLIAQELQLVIGEVVKTHDFKALEDGGEIQKVQLERLGVYYSDLIPVLINGIQEQQEMIDEQDAKIQQLESQLQQVLSALNSAGIEVE